MCPTKCHRDKSLAPVNPASRSTLLCPRPLAVSVQEKIVAVPIPHQILCKDAPPKARHDSGDLSEVLCSRMSRIRLLTCCSDAALWPHGIVSAAVRRSPPRWELRPRRALAAPLQDRIFRQLHRVLQKFHRLPRPCTLLRGGLARFCGRECPRRGVRKPPCTLRRTGSGTLSDAATPCPVMERITPLCISRGFSWTANPLRWWPCQTKARSDNPTRRIALLTRALSRS